MVLVSKRQCSLYPSNWWIRDYGPRFRTAVTLILTKIRIPILLMDGTIHPLIKKKKLNYNGILFIRYDRNECCMI
jgi:hypothetical protein